MHSEKNEVKQATFLSSDSVTLVSYKRSQSAKFSHTARHGAIPAAENSQETGVVQHLDDLLDLAQLLGRHLHPVVERLRQLRADLLARRLADVVERLQQHLAERGVRARTRRRRCRTGSGWR